MKSSTFTDLLAAIRAGDERAAAELVRAIEPYLRRVARLRLKDHEQVRRVFDSLDICQSILAQFFARAAAGEFDLRTPEDLRRLLVTMALNKVVSKFRRMKHHQGGLPEDWDTPTTVPPPDQAAADRDLIERVRERLSGREQWLLEQKALRGRTWADIAREVQADPDALRMQLTRAVARVRKELQGEVSHVP